MPPSEEMSKVDGDTIPSSEVENAQGYGSRNPLLYGLDGLTLYEKKCVLINREIDAQGMGKYQWYIWGLCGFGYLLDLLGVQAFGLVLGPLQQELGFGDDESGNISTSFNAGLTAGALFGGFWRILLNKRFLLACLSVFQPIGVVLCSAIAFGFIPVYACSPNFSESDPLVSCNNAEAGETCCSSGDNMGWRYLLFTIGGITLAVFILRFFVFNFRETPKYLIYRGR
ncbi:hypothetical protein BFJ63_vAg19593, partial [Fusarium oxysporum f. sp. narcissi]